MNTCEHKPKINIGTLINLKKVIGSTGFFGAGAYLSPDSASTCSESMMSDDLFFPSMSSCSLFPIKSMTCVSVGYSAIHKNATNQNGRMYPPIVYRTAPNSGPNNMPMPTPAAMIARFVSLSSGKHDVIMASPHVELNPAPIPPSVYARNARKMNRYMFST